MFKFYIKFIKTRRKLIICLIFLVVLYSLYISSNSWLIPKSVSNNENDAKNVMSLAKSRNSYLLPNLMHRQLVVNSSHIKTINTEKLISLLKTPLTQNSSIIAHNETQYARKRRLDKFCTKYGLKHRILTLWRKSTNEYKGRQRFCSTKNCPILVDQNHKFMFCFIQKIASTSMKKLFTNLREIDDNESPITNITAFHLTANDVLTRISPMFYSTNQNKKYLKAIFVRHPFLRLVSAFKDKAEKNRTEEPFFYAKYWDRMMRLERGNDSVNNDSKPVFSEFVKLLLRSKTQEFDEHWAPIWTRCEPCYIEYDFIGKLETPSDLQLLQNQIKPALKSKQLIWENSNHKSLNDIRREAKKYFLQISAQQIIDLYKIYFLDFKLFGYTIEEVFH